MLKPNNKSTNNKYMILMPGTLNGSSNSKSRINRRIDNKVNK